MSKEGMSGPESRIDEDSEDDWEEVTSKREKRRKKEETKRFQRDQEAQMERARRESLLQKKREDAKRNLEEDKLNAEIQAALLISKINEEERLRQKKLQAQKDRREAAFARRKQIEAERKLFIQSRKAEEEEEEALRRIQQQRENQEIEAAIRESRRQQQKEEEDIAAAIRESKRMAELEMRMRKEHHEQKHGKLNNVQDAKKGNKSEVESEHFKNSSVDITSCLDIFNDKKAEGVKNMRYIELQYIVKLKMIAKNGKFFLLISGDYADRVAIAKHKLAQVVSKPATFREELENHRKENIHVFVDNTNISLSAQQFPMKNGISLSAHQFPMRNGREFRDTDIKIRPEVVSEIVERQRRAKTRFCAGSHSNRYPQTKKWMAPWKEKQYKVYSLPNDAGGEHGVDETIQNEARKAILDHDLDRTINHTLILVTGDGNANDGKATFPEIVQSVILRRNWRAEVWSWQNCTSSTYKKMCKEFPSKMDLRYLDDYRSEITYKVSRERAKSIGRSKKNKDPERLSKQPSKPEQWRRDPSSSNHGRRRTPSPPHNRRPQHFTGPAVGRGRRGRGYSRGRGHVRIYGNERSYGHGRGRNRREPQQVHRNNEWITYEVDRHTKARDSRTRSMQAWGYLS
mmetsp:Transcript_3897/g.5754  ORF Transcript_3897/g.5754 Transcript_3897/m.5754 type:complete len:630 (+) Transcript_3897:48-1937(+)